MLNKQLLFILFVLSGLAAQAQLPGCTDPLAVNYNAAATENNGSCQYAPTVVAPVSSVALPLTVKETSGLLMWNDRFWTHNDNTDANLYALDTATAAILEAYQLPGITNTDWEDLAQDSAYFYLGDFGNNVAGNRTNLQILRIHKASLLAGAPVTDTIRFSYSDQTSFAPVGPNATDFDCEALIVSADSIYLFTKQWVSKNTSVYALPKTPGTFTANFRAVLAVQGLVTGATYLEAERLAALSGYSTGLQPFIYLLYDFSGHSFFDGNKRKIDLFLPYHQVEGIATSNGLSYFLTNEHFAQAPLPATPQKLHHINLNAYLQPYLYPTQVSAPDTAYARPVSVYPNPVHDVLNISGEQMLPGAQYWLTNQLGQVVSRGRLNAGTTTVWVRHLPAGVYVLHFNQPGFGVHKIGRQ